MSKPLILVTNDDGITAPGINALVEVMKELGDVVVVAPDSPQSGMGHAVTVAEPLRLTKMDYFQGIPNYQCTGTPVDCVKLAVDKVLHKKPDICVSGINHGHNASINLIYSGTLSAAMEAAIEGIPAIGFSLNSYDFEADLTASKKYAKVLVIQLIEKGLPKDTLLNVNIPACPPNRIKGIKICRQARAKWEEEFDERTDPRNTKYFWLTGKFVNYDQGEDTDMWAMENNYVSVVPVHFDFTAHHAFPFINENWNVAT